MKVQVHEVFIPAMSTVGWGRGQAGRRKVVFVGDHRPMHALGEALAEAGEPTEAEVESWQIVHPDLFDEAKRRADRDA